MRLTWISQNIWKRGRAGQIPYVHIIIVPAATLKAGLSVLRLEPAPFNACMHILEIWLITLWNNLFSVKVTRTMSFPRRQRLTWQTFLQSCLTTVRALLFAVKMPAVRLKSLGHLLRKLWGRCGFVLSRRPCWLPVQVRENPEEKKI